MKKSRFIEEQIGFALKQAEAGAPVEEICHTMGISPSTFFGWRKQFGGLGVAELRRQRLREEGHHKLGQQVVDLSFTRSGCRTCCREL